ncbi:hypothetical protein C8Q77DRAFT_1043571, partial [Trametes polyzona]
MASAVAGVRPPSSESRAAMLALYSATKTRFPVRTAWDCWHRWCTPWVVQDEPDPARPRADAPTMVLDYIAGNLCLPVGTWVTQASEFVYRPVPGTYPDAPGVQRRVTAGYDPRIGMVAFARMAHLLAERTWASMGLKRRSDGTVSEEVLVGRRAKLPGTLAGIWPGRTVSKPGANTRTATQPSSTPSSTGTQSQPATGQTRTTQPPAKPSTTAPAPAATTTTTAAANAAVPHTTTNPRPPFLPLPSPRPRPPVEPPHVPEGTFGHPTRPGMAAWFERAAIRADALERVLGIDGLRERFERAVREEVVAGHMKEEREGQKERERVPLHLRKLSVPPPP